MAGITISGAVRSNLLALQNITSQQDKIQGRLSTGKKVNTALDNATTFFTAASFTNRASSLTGLLDSVSNGIQALKAADTGIGSINKLVDQLKSTAQQALQSSSAYTAQAKVTSTNAVVGASGADIRGTAGAALVTGTADLRAYTAPAGDAGNLSINGKNVAVATGDTGAGIVDKINNTADIGVTAALDATTGFLKLTSKDPFSSVVIGAGTAATTTAAGLTAGTTASTNVLNGKTLSFTLSGGATTSVTFGDPATTAGSVKSLDDLNNKLSAVGISASIDSTGKIGFTTTSQTASQTFTVAGTATGAGNTFVTTASNNPVRGGAGADTRDSLVTQFNSLLSQIDTIAKDSNYNGLNLLAGDTLSLIFNETNTSRLDVQGSSASFSGLGLSTVAATNFNDGGGIDKVMKQLEGAKVGLESQASKLGASLAVVQTRQDFTKQTINTLKIGADNLTNADLNEEATNLLALNTSQQLAQQALSLSNQTQQGVLRLLG